MVLDEEVYWFKYILAPSVKVLTPGVGVPMEPIQGVLVTVGVKVGEAVDVGVKEGLLATMVPKADGKSLGAAGVSTLQAKSKSKGKDPIKMRKLITEKRFTGILVRSLMDESRLETAVSYSMAMVVPITKLSPVEFSPKLGDKVV